MNRKILKLIILPTVSLISQSAFGQDTNKYHGGSYDGYAMGLYSPIVFDSNKYHGGSYSGYGMGISASDIPLPVKLSSFTAIASDGQVTLEWVTESEIGNLGFHVYRSMAEKRPYECITTRLIEGAGNCSYAQTYSFVDGNVVNGTTYWYKLEDVAMDGTATMHDPIYCTPMAEGNELADAIPVKYGLSHNFPNPFNPITEIHYQLPEASHVVLAIYDELGREVKVLVYGIKEAGRRSVEWDAKDAASGIYFVRMQTENFVDIRKIVLAR
jgi:hypothetical protein